jgi:multidrug resistance protein, MATE family
MMSFRKLYLKDASLLLKLGMPLVLSGMMESSVGFLSTLFLARLGQQELAAGALVTWVFVTLMMILWGILTSVSVLIAKQYGKKNDKEISLILRDGLLLAVFLTIPAFILLWNMAPILLLFGQSDAVVTLANAYLHGLAWGLLPDFVGIVLLHFLIGLGHARSNMVFSILWVPTNIICNYILMFGKFGLPSLGIAGIGWGTTLSYWITTLGLTIYILLNRHYKRYISNIPWFGPAHFLRKIIKVGLPMGTMYCIEVGFFLTITLSIGTLGTQVLAANQIALQYSGQLIAVVFSIAQAVTVRMGHALGASETAAAERAGYAGIFISTTLMSIAALCYWFFPEKLIGLDFDVHNPKNSEIVSYAKNFLAICALFQIMEAVRITLFGALRSLGDNHFTLFISIISFWCVALPLGYLFSIQLHWGGYGFWWGMVIGAIFSMTLLFWRFRYKIKEQESLSPNSVSAV